MMLKKILSYHENIVKEKVTTISFKILYDSTVANLLNKNIKYQHTITNKR